MKKLTAAVLLMCIFFCGHPHPQSGNFCRKVFAKDEEHLKLYARSAVLTDADSGRVLYAKNSREQLPMASTTKIMTCILALENGDMSDIVTVSGSAALQPKVRLGMSKGESYHLEDLLYSLMLESHNDSAAAVAEHIGGSMRGFALLMNKKAKTLGCSDTYFITPGGLDANDGKGAHSSTAEDLATIMKYCIMDSPKKDAFLKITGTKAHDFTDCGGKRIFTVYNHNTFLNMMEGALCGKTGYTSGAGYCYVGALRDKDRTFIVSLLDCGRPGNKNLRWADTKKLMEYGLREFHYKNVWKDLKEQRIGVRNGFDSANIFGGNVSAAVRIKNPDREWKVLLGSGDTISISGKIRKTLDAPVEKGQNAGYIEYFLNGETLRKFELVTGERIEKRTYGRCLKTIAEMFFDII